MDPSTLSRQTSYSAAEKRRTRDIERDVSAMLNELGDEEARRMLTGLLVSQKREASSSTIPPRRNSLPRRRNSRMLPITAPPPNKPLPKRPTTADTQLSSLSELDEFPIAVAPGDKDSPSRFTFGELDYDRAPRLELDARTTFSLSSIFPTPPSSVRRGSTATTAASVKSSNSTRHRIPVPKEKMPPMPAPPVDWQMLSPEPTLSHSSSRESSLHEAMTPDCDAIAQFAQMNGIGDDLLTDLNLRELWTDTLLRTGEQADEIDYAAKVKLSFIPPAPTNLSRAPSISDRREMGRAKKRASGMKGHKSFLSMNSISDGSSLASDEWHSPPDITYRFPPKHSPIQQLSKRSSFARAADESFGSVYTSGQFAHSFGTPVQTFKKPLQREDSDITSIQTRTSALHFQEDDSILTYGRHPFNGSVSRSKYSSGTIPQSYSAKPLSIHILPSAEPTFDLSTRSSLTSSRSSTEPRRLASRKSFATLFSKAKDDESKSMSIRTKSSAPLPVQRDDALDVVMPKKKRSLAFWRKA